MKNHKSTSLRRLDGLARLIIKNDTEENCAAIAFVEGKWYITANHVNRVAANIETIFYALKRVVRDDVGLALDTEGAYNYLVHYLKDADSDTRLNRLSKDVFKFLEALKSEKIFTAKAIRAFLDCSFEIYPNEEKMHAELALASYFKNLSGHKLETKMGISKLCCKLCASGISAVNKVCKEVMYLYVRGNHDNIYHEWKAPDLLLSKKCFKKFVGRKAYNKFKLATSDTKDQIMLIFKNFSLIENYEDLKKDSKVTRGRSYINSTQTTTESSLSPHYYSSTSEEPEDSSSETS